MDSGLKCIADVTVDDVLILTNLLSMRTLLLDALTARFGPLTVNLDSTLHTGVEMVRLSNGGILLHQDTAIARAASSLVGVSHLPAVVTPADASFFLPAFDGDETVPVAAEEYSSVTGILVHFLKTRADVRLLISYLCSFNHSPREGHLRRALHVLRYLASTPSVGPVFKSSSIELFVFSDAAYGVFRDGYSSSAHLYCVGRFNAPFHSCARAQSDVATCPMTAEYYSASGACKGIVFHRQLSGELGWPLPCPTLLILDNRTAISLIRAPQVSVKSRHIEQQHHYVRSLHANHTLVVEHVVAALMRANVLSKVLPRARFLAERAMLFNTASYV